MKDKTIGPSKKNASSIDVRPSGRRASNVLNPFLLPEFDEENYDPRSESAPSVNEETKSAPTIRQKGGGMSFKKVAKAITQQRRWSNVLKVMFKSD